MQDRSRRFDLLEEAREDGAQDADFAHAVANGLGAPDKSLPCRFFYDAEGSRLFEQICRCEEYYPTRAEREILVRRAAELAGRFPGDVDLIELGSGSAEKTEVLIAAFLAGERAVRYVPVDICREVLEQSSERLLEAFPRLEIRAVEAEYAAGLRHLKELADRTRVVLWLGSNVGNFDRATAARFLGEVRATLSEDDALVLGVDLRKDRRTLEAAYDDAAGVTARFNKNLLVRINDELEGEFDPDAFRHEATWDEEHGRVDMWLVSLRDQRVRVGALGRSFSFDEGERIHTESSYKYSREEIDELASRAGFVRALTWLDDARRYSLSLLEPTRGE